VLSWACGLTGVERHGNVPRATALVLPLLSEGPPVKSLWPGRPVPCGQCGEGGVSVAPGSRNECFDVCGSEWLPAIAQLSLRTS